ncbi:NAD-dependent epimerase/dehydratase family protein [Pseudactinotalea sp. HY158]|uniref:NAD-dependent epimerase/dehydratase family protein n=1 Tax=Pseudactinotalea sp. HY158 TaxID=2654547 RepID=UPI00129C784F|nr:NAD-dependent epimerase/dehydratase family protein [Pseudactinotalea sp. HY158]QGH68279.1 NAD-dependent epimerase/dehydratase family protein [Pseudactinotalea sp. HY158]
MSEIVVLGAGPIGSATATLFAERGETVRLLSRSGRGPTGPRLTTGTVDAADTDALRAATAGADVIVNAINLPYHQWSSGWPPIHRAILTAAESSGAVLAVAGSFYGYAPGRSPMTPDLPLEPATRKGAIRARMWTEILRAHEAGRVRALEVRASDYVGPQVTSPLGAHAGPRLLDPVLRGRRAWVVGDPDAPHTWTSIDDIARTIVTLAADERAWGRAWHVPSAPARSIRDVAGDYARAAGLDSATVSRIPRAALRAIGIAQPQLREVLEMLYQFDAPFVADHEETTRVFGLDPTPWKETVAAVVAARVPARAM